MRGQRTCLQATLGVELAQLRDRTLNDAPPDAHALDQPPVAMALAVLASSRRAQVHAAITAELAPSRKTQGRHYTVKSPSARARVPECAHGRSSKTAENTRNRRRVAQVGLEKIASSYPSAVGLNDQH